MAIIFLKGHLEGNENDFEAAIRETREESGLVLDKDFICNDILKHFDVFYPTKKGIKKVVYYIGKVEPNAKVELSEETCDFKWLTLKEIKYLNTFLKFPELTQGFENAENYLVSLNVK